MNAPEFTTASFENGGSNNNQENETSSTPLLHNSMLLGVIKSIIEGLQCKAATCRYYGRAPSSHNPLYHSQTTWYTADRRPWCKSMMVVG